MSSIAFIGLGAMGFGMATQLLESNLPVTGFDICKPTLARFATFGGKTSSTPREAALSATHIIIMVATAAQALFVLFDSSTGAVHSIQKNATVILCSTSPLVHVPEVRRLLDEHGRSDVKLVDAPVSGGTVRAANGTLTILAAGTEGDVDSAKPILDVLAGESLYVIPGGLGAGTKVKMIHQILAGIHVCMACEALGFAAALGLDTNEVFEGLKGSQGDSWMLRNRGAHMVEGDQKVYSALNMVVKDIGIVTSSFRHNNLPAPLSSAAEQVILTGIRSYYGLDDDSRLVRVYLPKTPDLVHFKASPAPTPTSKMSPITKILSGVHLASAAEAISLSRAVGLQDQGALLYEIIKGAAGASWMFIDRAPGMMDGSYGSVSKAEKTVDEVIADLSGAIEEAGKIKYPLHVTAAALQVYQLAALRGLGGESDSSIMEIWKRVSLP